MSQFLQAAAYGVVQGGLLGLVAVGFSLVWGVMNVVNFSHGALAVTGAYVAWVLNVRFGLDPFLAIPVVAIALFAFGYVVQRGLINLVINAPIFLTLLLTFGLNLVILNGLQLLLRPMTGRSTPRTRRRASRSALSMCRTAGSRLVFWRSASPSHSPC